MAAAAILKPVKQQ